MINRRDAIASFAVLAEFLATGASAETQATAQPAAPRPLVFKGDLPNVSLEGWEVTVTHVDYAPGRSSGAHRHAGFVLAYVVQGSIASKVTGMSEEKIYTPGQMFYEFPGSTHEVSRNASQTEPARLLAMIFAPKGATLTTPVPQ